MVYDSCDQPMLPKHFPAKELRQNFMRLAFERIRAAITSNIAIQPLVVVCTEEVVKGAKNGKSKWKSQEAI